VLQDAREKETYSFPMMYEDDSGATLLDKREKLAFDLGVNPMKHLKQKAHF
jgi:hypothetical protein